ncbi:MAG TPA: hypothetical protein VMV17_24865 [Streptosporangiaceae bacterium]|nr:hypothetical protein [Streptosporangiaceae bacterium]
MGASGWSGDEEDVAVFGHDQPSRAEYDAPAEDSPLRDDDGRWTGRCLVRFQAGRPESVAFWGCSGD